MNKLSNWLLPKSNGLILIVFGLIALLFPSITLSGITLFFGISILLGGLILLIRAFIIDKKSKRFQFSLLEGILSTILGIVVLSNLASAASVFAFLIGAWSFLIGLSFLFVNRSIKSKNGNSYLLLTSGILSLLFGLVIMLNPFESARLLVILIGVHAVLYGSISLSFSR